MNIALEQLLDMFVCMCTPRIIGFRYLKGIAKSIPSVQAYKPGAKQLYLLANHGNAQAVLCSNLLITNYVCNSSSRIYYKGFRQHYLAVPISPLCMKQERQVCKKAVLLSCIDCIPRRRLLDPYNSPSLSFDSPSFSLTKILGHLNDHVPPPPPLPAAGVSFRCW